MRQSTESMMRDADLRTGLQEDERSNEIVNTYKWFISYPTRYEQYFSDFKYVPLR